MVRVVLTYGPTSPRLRADLSSLTADLSRSELSGTHKNVSPVFEMLMEKVLTNLTCKTCIADFDDILISSKSFEKHEKVREVFQWPKEV